MTIERDLRRLADGFPDVPPLVPGVLAAVQRASVRRRRRRRVGVLALALLLLVPAAALAVSPGLRDRVLETFGLRGVTIERVAHLPRVGPDARRLQLGPPVSLARARRDLRLRVDPPAALGAPDGIYSENGQAGVVVSFLYEPRAVAARLGPRTRVLVSVLRGALDENLLAKTLALATHVERLRIEGGRAVIISGVPHLVVLFPRGDAIGQLRSRLVGTTLVWQRKALIVRVEGDLPNPVLVRIARSVSTG